jgi:hypothetical protein
MPRSPDNVEAGFYSIEMLRTALKVSRRSIERAIEAGHIKPCCYTVSGRRARFSKKQVEELKCRARNGRSLGSKYVMAHITSTGTTPPPIGPSASAWLRKKALKHNPDMLASYKVAMKYLDLDAMLDV